MPSKSCNDAKMMAELLHSMKSGLSTFERVFDHLERRYTPFNQDEFITQFYKCL